MTSSSTTTTPAKADARRTPVPDAESAEPLTPSPSGDSSSVSRTPTPAMSMSPARPTQPSTSVSTPVVPSTPSVPASPAAPPSSSSDRSPAMTPTPNSTPQQQQQQQQQQRPLALEQTGVVLGLEQLERQQDEAERRRRERIERAKAAAQSTSTSTPQQQAHRPHHPQAPQSAPPVHSTPVMIRYHLDDDTAPSSAPSGTRGDTTGDGSLGSGDDASSAKESTKFKQMIKNTRRRLSSNDFLRRRSSDNLDDPAEDDEEGAVDALIYGHLQKLGRNGKWQTRWFECDGECLSYYKSSKRSKLLATLDLEKVGAIIVNEDDPKGCSFKIQVLGRPYYLRAESRAACKDWVITLNRVKEARLQQGNTKLIHAKHILFRSPPDLLDRSNPTGAFTQGIAIENPHRPRTRAVDESTMENMEEMMLKADAATTDPSMVNPAFYRESTADTDSLSQVVLARWQKRKSSMSRMASKLSRWAKSLKKYRCTDVEEADVRLDRHVHPPGHDNPKKKPTKKVVEREVVPPPKDAALTGWIGKETSLAAKGGPMVIDPEDAIEVIDQSTSDPVVHSASSVSSIAPEEEEEEEPRELS